MATFLAAIVLAFGFNAATISVPASILSDCNDTAWVYVDVESGVLYGDQDGNGRLDGSDCDWR